MSPFEHDKRRAMHPTRVARVFAACNGKCYVCGRKMRPGDSYEVDHEIALACGGTDEDDNTKIICTGCHLVKTGGDISTAARIKRQAVNHTVPKEFRRSRAWGRR